jgi:hypothetical protein
MKLQEAHALLEDVLARAMTDPHPGLDLAKVEGAFADALRHLYGVLLAADSVSARERLTQTVAGIDVAMALLSGTPQLLELLGRARAGLATAVAFSPEQEERPSPLLGALRASVEEPQLLEWARPILRPTLPLPERARPLTAGGEPPEDPRAAHFGVQLTEADVLRERARCCLEDMANLRSMRVPMDDQGWAGRAVAEQRLLSRVDALAAVGEPFWPGLVKQLERPVVDAGLWWANLFFFGSLAGPDALDQVLRLLRLAPLDLPEVRNAAADALSFAPHRGLSEALRPFLRGGAPERRWLAVTALSRRGALNVDELQLGARDSDEAVVEATARALGHARGQLNPAILRMLLYRPEEAVVRAALETAFIWRARAGFVRVRALCEERRPDFAQAAVFLALGSDGKDFELLVHAAQEGSEWAVRALGWLGDLRAVDPLLEVLGEDKRSAAALEALQQLTGASIGEDGAPTRDETAAQPFTPTYLPPEVGLLSRDRTAWSAWWEKHRSRAKAGARFRLGHLWGPDDNFRSMEAAASHREERWWSYLELCVRLGESAPFDPAAFVRQQRRQLETWRSLHQARTGHRAGVRGAWPTRWEG